jgi:hypothetical protein
VAAALAFTHLKQDDARFTAADLKLKLYPSERAPGGLAVAATAGYAHVRSRGFRCAPDIVSGSACTDSTDSGDALSTGIELDHTWMLGARKRFTVLLGLGVKRLYFIGDEVGDVDRVQPVLRFTVGYAF